MNQKRDIRIQNMTIKNTGITTYPVGSSTSEKGESGVLILL